jgi:glyoxylase-like metal-dependent hydrolase (beta-lactamase superfamily II)
LNTHAHADHIGGNEAIKATTLAPLAVHRLEASWLADPQLNMSALMGEPVVSPPADILFEHEYRFQMCGLDIFVRHTPGHTPGSSSFLIGNTLFCGDALFRESVGRTDLPEGSHDQLIESIRQQILTLPDDTRICPGHGPFTTVEHERANNPFL